MSALHCSMIPSEMGSLMFWAVAVQRKGAHICLCLGESLAGFWRRNVNLPAGQAGESFLDRWSNVQRSEGLRDLTMSENGSVFLEQANIALNEHQNHFIKSAAQLHYIWRITTWQLLKQLIRKFFCMWFALHKILDYLRLRIVFSKMLVWLFL